MADGDLENGTILNGTSLWATGGGTATGVAIRTDGGKTGANYLAVPASAGYSYVQQGNTNLEHLQVGGATFIAEVWARCTVANTEARIALLDPNNPTALTYEWYTTLTAGAGWQRLRIPFSIQLATTNLQIRLSRRGGTGDIHFDGAHVYAA